MPAELCWRQAGPYLAARTPQHGRDEDFAWDGRGDGRRQTRGGGDVSDNRCIVSQVPTPPVAAMPARLTATRCRLGSRAYCPGETLFRVGVGRVRAKVRTAACQPTCLLPPGSGVHRGGEVLHPDAAGGLPGAAALPAPQVHPHRTALCCDLLPRLEYCDGEMLRGFMAWSFVQQCR